ncbi:elongation of very long chain fatty acids protein 5 [Apostasia shenzhenica]|uniref:very-long-chain 3-oxoacyl-CoA synthase n=1 Tax=Apostasia shenzhenica TaxID=1088818 RepID=A0A2I0AVF4_9ASPA|nr:elongation of very long chain fatty acids protein 5 [Apostasia shenzhenica]
MESWPPPLRQLRRWLVDPPAISSFEWIPNKTFASSLPFLSATVVCYLSLTVLLHRRLLPLPFPPPATLRLLSAAHNLFILLLSATMAAGASLSALAQMPSPRWLLCFPTSTPARGPIFFWAQIFYISKIYEFADTALILLAGGRRLSFLHVYHHAAVVVMCYLWLSTAQSLLPIALVTNASVHVVMYAYYLSASLGRPWRRRWKRGLTLLQIVQFVFSFTVSGGFLWLHFAGGGCEGMKGWIFNAAFNASLLALFQDFYSAAYSGAASATSGGGMEVKRSFN